MCGEPEPRIWLIVVLSVWLTLGTARQIFDLIGKLWIPVAFNLLQILTCITGLFAVCQHRVCLLIVLSTSSTLLIAYNTLIVLWYSGILGDTTKPLLSAGLPYSYSFFLRHTPYCHSHFNLSTTLWVQSPCLMPFNQIESIQAIVHLTLAIVTLSLSILVLCARKANQRYSHRGHVKQPKITVEFAGTASGGSRLKTSNRMDSVHNLGSAYMNSSYEESTDREAIGDAPMQNTTMTGARPQNGYVRQSARRPRIRAPRPPSCSSAIYQQRSAGSDDYSAATTIEAGGGGGGGGAGSSTNGRLSRASCRRGGSARGTRSCYLDEDWSDYEDPYTKPKVRSGSMKSFKLAATEGVRRMLSHEQLAASSALGDRTASQRCSASNLTSLVSFDPKSNTLIRVREHFGDETDDDDLYEVANSRAQKNSPLTTAATATTTAATATYTTSTTTSTKADDKDSNAPSMQAPTIGSDRFGGSHSSPSSSALTEQSYNRRAAPASTDYARSSSTRSGTYTMMSGDSFEAQQPPSPSPAKAVTSSPIGYEPALCDPLPVSLSYDPAKDAGIPLAYEPIYRSMNQVLPHHRRPAASHYHDPNSLRLMAYENEPRAAPSPPASLPIINGSSLLV